MARGARPSVYSPKPLFSVEKMMFRKAMVLLSCTRLPFSDAELDVSKYTYPDDNSDSQVRGQGRDEHGNAL